MSTELLKKADFALSNLVSDGGLLTVEQQDRFLNELIDQPTIMRLARTVPMNSPQMELSALGFGDRVVRPGTEGTALAGNTHAVPQIRTVNLTTKLYKAQTNMTYEVLEDNIARGTVEQAIMAQFVKAVARDMEELVIQGDTASGDAYLATQNGLVKRITTNSVNATTTGNTPKTYNNAINALADRFKNPRPALRFFVPTNIEQDYRLGISNRQTSLGDAYLTGNAGVSVMGVPMINATYMPAGTGVLIDPFNLIIGIQRNVRIESDRDIERGVIKYVISYRMAVQLENEKAAVKITNIG